MATGWNVLSVARVLKFTIGISSKNTTSPELNQKIEWFECVSIHQLYVRPSKILQAKKTW